MKQEKQMIKLISILKRRQNDSYKFFEDLLHQLKNGNEREAALAMATLLSCYAITQYSDFTAEEDRLLSDIIDANA